MNCFVFFNINESNFIIQSERFKKALEGFDHMLGEGYKSHCHFKNVLKQKDPANAESFLVAKGGIEPPSASGGYESLRYFET
jgi:endonuclease IV